MARLSSRLLIALLVAHIVVRPDALASGDKNTLAQLGSTDRGTCLQAIDSLQDDQLKAPAVQAALLKLLSHLDEEVGLNAALKLSRAEGAVLGGIRGHLKSEDEAVRFRAALALGSMGSRAHPALDEVLERTRDDDEAVRGKVAFVLMQIAPDDARVRLALLKALKDPSRVVRFNAWQAIGAIGVPMVPALEKLVRAGEQAPAVFSALGEIVEKNKTHDGIKPIAKLVPLLVDYLVDESFPYESRFGVWQVLGHFHHESTPLLLKKLAQPELPQRNNCSAVLNIIARDLAKRNENPEQQDRIATAMRERLLDHDVLVAQSANGYFFAHPGRARAAEAQYRQLMRHDDSMCRDWGRHKLTSWGFDPAGEAWARYQKATGDEKIRAACDWRLAGSPFNLNLDVDQLLTKNLNHPSAALRYEIIRVLYPERSWRGPLPEKDQLPVATLLLERMKDKDPEVRFDAMRRFAKYQLGTKETGAQLALLLKDKHHGVRYYACEALTACVKAEPKSYVPLLAPLLDDPGDSIRWSAAKALSAGGEEAYEPLVSRLRRRAPGSYWMCTELPKIGAKAKDALPMLRELVLSKDDFEARTAARTAFAKIDAEFAAKSVVEQLRKNDAFRAFPDVKNWGDIDAVLQKMAAADDPVEATRAIEAWGHFFVYLHFNVGDRNAPSPQQLCAKLFPTLHKNLNANDVALRRRTAQAIFTFRDARFRGEYGNTMEWDPIEMEIEEMLQSRRYDEDLIVRRIIRKALAQHGIPLDGV